MTPRVALALLLALPALALATPQAEFVAFKAKFNKSYQSPEEEAARFKIFSANLAEVGRVRQGASYSVGVTQFTDLTNAEFRAFHLGGLKRPQPGTSTVGTKVKTTTIFRRIKLTTTNIPG
jgi:hypothetical protein